MQPIVYLFFPGTCAEAMRFYAATFGSEEPEILAVGTMPPEVRSQMPPMEDETVMHAALKVGAGWIYASDDMTSETPAMAGCNISVSFPTLEEAHRVFAVLAEGGEVRPHRRHHCVARVEGQVGHVLLHQPPPRLRPLKIPRLKLSRLRPLLVKQM